MKVLTIKEPFASLIANGIKHIETRSWKTSYRGEIYIHAGASISIDDRHLERLIEPKCGYILCKCNLVDCVYMDKEFLKNIKTKDEYLYGEYKEGRYAWILDDVEVVEKIKVKGSLGIWNYYTLEQVMDLMSDIRYGYLDKDNNVYLEDYSEFGSIYKLASPKEVIKYKVGVCFDQVELERYYFKGRDIKTYFISYNDIKTHTFMVVIENDMYYWFEYAWVEYKGIYEYETLDELISDVKNKFCQDCGCDNAKVYEYSKPEYGISAEEFINKIKDASL